ncbi:HPP family protein [Blastococcus sp. SYSU D00669]
MQARDVMTRGVVTVGPDTSAKYAAEVMAERGFAALPVVDEDDLLVGIVAEADVLRDRMPPDPRLHARRDAARPARRRCSCAAC